MSYLKICRICLRTEAKMYNFSLHHLKLYYEELMAIKVEISGKDGLPHHFCYECATLLHKFHKFKEKCYTGQKVLEELLWSGPITYESIYTVDRKGTMLSSSLSIIRVNNRVKTYTTTDTKEKEIVAKLGNIELDCFSEASLSDIEDQLNNDIIGEEISDEENKETDDTRIPIDDDELKFDEINITSGNTLKFDDINVPSGDTVNFNDINIPSGNTLKFDDINIPSGNTLKCDDINIPSGNTLKCDDINIPSGNTLKCDDINIPSGNTLKFYDINIRSGDTIKFDERNVPSGDTIKFDDRNVPSGDTIKFDDKNVPSGDDSLIFDKKKIARDDANIKIHEEKKVANSPVVVSVESQKDDIKPSPKKIKQKAKKRNNKTTPAWKDQEKSENVLKNKNIWKSIILSEEEALKEFRAKADDKKYLAAAFKCKDCFKGFSKKDMLDRHIQLHHIEELGSLECRFCHYRFRLICYVNRHMKHHYCRYECLRCNLLCQYEKSAILHEEFHSGAKKKCKYCDREFSHTSTYYTHLRSHRSEHVCTLCGISFVSKLGLQKHKNIKHVIIEIESPDDDEDVNTFCKRCDIRFETRKAYEEHLFHSALHSNDEGRKNGDNDDEKIKHGTDSTEKESASRNILDKKEQTKIIKDPKQNKDGSSNSIRIMELKRLRKKEKIRLFKPTTCHHCGKHFETQAGYTKHHLEAHPRTPVHPPNKRHICEICGTSLAPGSVASHSNMHTREILHSCDTCGRQFNSVTILRRHQVTHTGEKPYGCPLCDKRFTQSNSMKLHYRTFHLKQPYPKRNRRKKQEEPKEATTETNNTEESVVKSDDN